MSCFLFVVLCIAGNISLNAEEPNVAALLVSESFMLVDGVVGEVLKAKHAVVTISQRQETDSWWGFK